MLRSDDTREGEAYTLFLMTSLFCCTEWGLHGLKRTKCSAVRSCTSPTTGGSLFPDTDTSSRAISWPSPRKHHTDNGQSVLDLTKDQLKVIFVRLVFWKDSPSIEMSFTWQLSHTTVNTWQLLSAVVGKNTTCKHTHWYLKHTECIWIHLYTNTVSKVSLKRPGK